MRRAVFLIFLPFLALSQEGNGNSSSQSNVGNFPLVWFCSVRPFSKKFEALGASRAEARLNAREACMKEHNEMHCQQTFSCEGPSSAEPLGWTCTLSPRAKRLMVASLSRLEAKFKVQALCKAEASEILCENPICTEG